MTSRFEAVALLHECARQADEELAAAAISRVVCTGEAEGAAERRLVLAQALAEGARADLACLVEAVNHEARAEISMSLAVGWEQVAGHKRAREEVKEGEDAVRAMAGSASKGKELDVRLGAKTAATGEDSKRRKSMRTPAGAAGAASNTPPEAAPSSTVPSCETKRRRGRPKGSKNKVARVNDHLQQRPPETTQLAVVTLPLPPWGKRVPASPAPPVFTGAPSATLLAVPVAPPNSSGSGNSVHGEPPQQQQQQQQQQQSAPLHPSSGSAVAPPVAIKAALSASPPEEIVPEDEGSDVEDKVVPGVMHTEDAM